MPVLARLSPQLLSLLRIMCGLLLLEHGLQKLFQFPPPDPPRVWALTSLSGMSGIFEFVGGILLTLGLFTRTTAFILSGEMACAYFIRHAPRGFFPILNLGELAIVYCFLFLYLAAVGGGPWSLDALAGEANFMRRKSSVR